MTRRTKVAESRLVTLIGALPERGEWSRQQRDAFSQTLGAGDFVSMAYFGALYFDTNGYIFPPTG